MKILATVKRRFLSMTMVLGIAFVLLVSLVLSAGVAAVGHRKQQAEPVKHAVLLALDQPPPAESVVGADALPHALHGLVVRACPGRASDVPHHLGVAVQRDQLRLVGRAQPSQAESPRLEHDPIILARPRGRETGSCAWLASRATFCRDLHRRSR